MHQKLVPDPFLILVNTAKQPLHAQNYFKKLDILKKNCRKVLKKLTLYFLSNAIPFNGYDYKQQKEPGTSDQSLSGYKNKFRKIPLLVLNYLNKFDGVTQSSF